jgi:ABC-type antimicrobial peptide transport system permease subunit
MKQSHPTRKPPLWATWLLERFCAPDLLEEMRGDLEELYSERAETLGRKQANIRYVQDVLSLMRPFILKRKPSHYPPLNHSDMLVSYLTIACRNLIRQKVSSLINISGLSIGMAVAILISLWVYDELSFNTNHQNYDSIVKVYRKQSRPGETFVSTYNPAGLGTLLKNEYRDHFKQVVMVWGGAEEQVIAFGENTFTQSGYFMQPEGPEMFTLPMVYGSRQGLKDVNSILLSETLSKKLFGDKNPVNEIVRIDAKWDLMVTGVYKDLPKNSEFSKATYFAPLNILVENDMASLTVWDNQNMYIYAQLQRGADYKRVSALIKDAFLAHVDEEKKKSKPEVLLLPMKKWHLYSKFENGLEVDSDELKFVRLYGMIGLFVLLLACINFMNLSTARSATRAKEVGIRKTIGSVRSQLIGQFLSESVLVAFLAFGLSLLLVYLSLPWFNSIADKEMAILWTNPLFWMAAIGFTLFTGIVAGSYPALYLSSFNPVKVLKGSFRAGTSQGAFLRKGLVTFQFTVSITLTIGTVIVYQQIEHAKNRPVGYSRQGLISLHPTSPEYKGKYEVLRDELKKTGVVEAVAQADYPLTNTRGNNDGFDWKGKDGGMEDPSFNTISVTHDYGKTVGLEFISGRDFSREYATDNKGVLINESAAKLMGLENPVGEIVRSPEWMGRKNYQILGVVKDMVKESPFTSTRPSIIFLSQEDQQWLFVRMKENVSASQALPRIGKVFKSIVPSAPFDYKFADEEYNTKFQAEERIGKLAAIFAFLAIFISCLGLFALTSYTAEQRKKEIGIRKVLGASVSNIWALLSKDFVGLVMLACLIAAPIAWYFLSGWLENYEYRITISAWIFAIAGAFALLITIATVSYQAIKVALANPVKSLRDE